MAHSARTPTAIWNPARDVWETPNTESLFCGHLAVYSGTFPPSGTTRNGALFGHRMSVHHTSVPGSSSSPTDAMLPTPVTQPDTGNGHARNLGKEAALLPTPVAQPSHNSPEAHLRKKPGRAIVTDLSIIVENGLLVTGGALLPTPTASDISKHAGQHPDKRRAGGHSVSIQDVVEHLPTPPLNAEATLIATDWGKYGPAIRRWENVLGRPAPAPTQPSPRTGKPQLAPRFVEWMMGWPDGWVTDPALWADMKPSAARNAQLKIGGNGVVTLQAAYALEDMGIRDLITEGVAA